MRKVIVSEYKANGSKWEKKEKGVASFHSFGVNYEQFEGGPGHFSTAIVEYPDGQVDNVPVEMIRFIEDF
jgi:hypothetical protein